MNLHLFCIIVTCLLFSPVLIYAQQNEVPSWVNQIFQYWSNNEITDDELFYALNFLVHQGIVSNSSLAIFKSKATNDYSLFEKPKNFRIYFSPVSTNSIDGAIDDSMLFWKKNNVNFISVDDPKAANVKVSWIKEMSGPSDGYVVDGKIEIAYGLNNDGEWHEYDQKTMSFLLKHELGHFLGCSHSVIPNDIMYPKYDSMITYDGPRNCR